MRSGVAQATTAGNQAGATGNQLMGQAGQIGAPLTSALTGQIQQGMTPQQMNQALVSGAQAEGGVSSGVTGMADLEAARSRNAGANTMALDAAARTKGQQLSENALGVSQMALNRQMQAERMGSELYGTQLGAAMHAYGLIPQDVDAAARANQTGWLQNMNQTIAALGGGAQGAGALGLKI